MDTTDVVIIGAGPAGLSAAQRLSAAGLSVWLIDENSSPGGQFLRHVTQPALAPAAHIFGPEYAAGKDLAASAHNADIRYLPHTLVWQITADRQLSLLSRTAGAQPLQVKAQYILLATGAQERSFPLPGWTLPGAMTVGAAQLLMKSAGLLPPTNSVLVGNGPLLLLFAAQVLRAGGRLQAILDTTQYRDYLHSVPYLPRALRHASQPLFKGLNLLREIKRAGVPYLSGVTQIAIQGEHTVRGIQYQHRKKNHRLSTSSVLSHIGVIPEVQLANALGCQLAWDTQQQYWYPQTDSYQQTSLTNVFIAGDGGGIIGAEAAVLSGKLAALGILKAMGQLSEEQAQQQSQPLRRQIKKQQALRPFLSKLYPLPSQLHAPDDKVFICRCEQVSAGEIRQAAHLGCQGANQLKAFTRCGMGPCQGRMCMHNATRLLAETQQRAVVDIGVMRVRFPLKPITVADMAQQNVENEEP